MCGIVAMMSSEPVNQRIYDALHLLQHRGQDAAGIATLDGLEFHMYKAMGLVRDVFRTRNMRDLTGNMGVGQVRYPTQGCASSNQESQPFYVNAPYGIAFAHNGNLTNAEALKQELYETDRRHINTTSDSEVLLNVLATEISRETVSKSLDAEGVFAAVSRVHKRLRGSYAVVALIAGKGLLAFRDPYGIRPICFGSNMQENGKLPDADASDAMSVRVQFDAQNATGFSYDADSKTYRMLHADGTPQLDANNGQQADFDNLLILFSASTLRDDGVTLDYDLTMGGGVWLNEGHLWNITWTQGSETTFFLYDSNGRPLTLTAGRSYLALVSSLTGQELTVQNSTGENLL